MIKLFDNRPILGIDPSKRGLGFVFFVKGVPVDWGIRRIESGSAAALTRILDICPADVLVLEDPDDIDCHRRVRIRQLLRELALNAQHHGLEVCTIPRRRVRGAWANRAILRKDAVAAAIAEQFPVLQPLVPRRRKIFMDEEPHARIFDAASLVLHVLGLAAAGHRNAA